MLEKNESPTPHLAKDIVKRLKAFRGVSKFKRAAMSVLVKTIKPDELSKLRNAFEAIDKDKTGVITAKELRTYLLSKN
jgi:Ca2+-binding EF-hand superfamily protein